MDMLNLPRLRAPALPPIGRRESLVTGGLMARAAATFCCAMIVAMLAIRPAPMPESFDAGLAQNPVSSSAPGPQGQAL